MNIKEIAEGIRYVGVNDRVTEKFEGMWPLPYGVSYNSYLVEGSEKTALMDTVEIEGVNRYLDEVTAALQGRALDYLVIHHMEPDHSGSIPEVLKRWPGIKVVCSRQAADMVKGFYHVEDADMFIIVNDGDSIDLGGKTLQFVMTPMVHWPETMMTLVPELKLLFSGDAFGCFGALNGAIIDADMDTSRYIGEMYRYYSNIVGKYGKFVQKALGKLEGVALDYICSTHGPVWHERIGDVTAIYDKLSRYGSEPGAVIVYGSMYGNTAAVAEEIARGLADAGVRNIIVHNASVSPMSLMISDAFRHKCLIVGSATYSMTLFPPVAAFIEAMKVREIKDKVFAGFGGYTWAPNAVKGAMEKFCAETGIEMQEFVMMKQSIDSSVRTQAFELGKKLASIEGVK